MNLRRLAAAGTLSLALAATSTIAFAADTARVDTDPSAYGVAAPQNYDLKGFDTVALCPNSKFKGNHGTVPRIDFGVTLGSMSADGTTGSVTVDVPMSKLSATQNVTVTFVEFKQNSGLCAPGVKIGTYKGNGMLAATTVNNVPIVRQNESDCVDFALKAVDQNGKVVATLPRTGCFSSS